MLPLKKLAQQIRKEVAQNQIDQDASTRVTGNTPARNKVDLSKAEFDEKTQLWRLTDPLGYVRLYREKPTPRNYFKYDYEHRKVLAEALGRELLRREIIHHLDGNKANNVRENLQLLANHLEHMKLHPEWRQRRNMRQDKPEQAQQARKIMEAIVDEPQS